MTKRRADQHDKDPRNDRPVQINMTDLGWSEDNQDEDVARAGERDIHAAGTPGGGTASGGLAGSNAGHGDPDNVDLEDALGSGILDTGGDDKGDAPYAGHAGGAVGGTPAEKRARGGNLPPRKHNATGNR